MTPCTDQLAYGADLLKANGTSIPCFVTLGDDLIPCRWNGTLNGRALLVRISDGRQSNNPVHYGQIVLSEDVAAQCAEARSKRLEGVQAAQIWAMQHQGQGRGSYSAGTRHYNSQGGYR